MNRTITAFLLALIGLNTVGLSFLIFEQTRPIPNAQKHTALSNSELEQLDKLYKLALEFRVELEQMAGRVTFPSEKAKTGANNYLQNHQLDLNFARLKLDQIHRAHSPDAAIDFIAICWGDSSFFSEGTALIDVEENRFSDYKSDIGFVPYPNASFSRLSSLNNEFRVLALSFVNDLK